MSMGRKLRVTIRVAIMLACAAILWNGENRFHPIDLAVFATVTCVALWEYFDRWDAVCVGETNKVDKKRDTEDLTTAEILAHGFVIHDGGTEASKGSEWVHLCGRCRCWYGRVNHIDGSPYPLCDNCLDDLE